MAQVRGFMERAQDHAPTAPAHMKNPDLRTWFKLPVPAETKPTILSLGPACALECTKETMPDHARALDSTHTKGRGLAWSHHKLRGVEC
ncbi:hypothetical protein MTO96_046670 [Rhipicephalus appendiculatus]